MNAGRPSHRLTHAAGPRPTTEIAGERLIILPRSHQVLHLNAVATWAYNQISGGITTEALVARTVATFEVDESTARADMQLLVQQWVDLGIVAREAE